MKLHFLQTNRRLHGILSIIVLGLVISPVGPRGRPQSTEAQEVPRTMPADLIPADGRELIRPLSPEERAGVIRQLLTERQTHQMAPPDEWHPSEAQAASTSNGSIAYVNPDDELWLIDPDGNNPRSLTQTLPLTVTSHAAWSPDKSRLAFAAKDESDTVYLHIISSEGGDPRTLSHPFAVIDYPSWSPDGRHIAFNAWEANDTRGTYVITVQSGDLTRLAHDDIYDIHGNGITWSPDGEWIAFTLRKNNGRWSLFKARPDGSGLQELASMGGEFSCENRCVDCSNDPAFLRFPTWSPDGTHITFLAGRGRAIEDELNPRCVPLFDIFVADPRGIDPPWRLVEEIVNAENPTNGTNAGPMFWSPDNVTLAMSGLASDGKWHLYTVDVPNREVRRLDCKRAGSFTWFDWSPDGTRVAAGFVEGASQDLHIVNPTDQCSEKLADGRRPAWGTAVSSVGWWGEYYDGRNFDTPVFVRDDWSIAFDWKNRSPEHEGIATNFDNFSVRWTKALAFSEGTYTFRVTADDGIRLYIDGETAIDTWDDPSPNTELIAEIPLTDGEHTIRLEYYEANGNAKVFLTWNPFLELPIGYDCGQWQENALHHFGGTHEAFRIAVLARNNGRPEGGNACQQEINGQLRPRETRRINSYFDHQYPTYDRTQGQVVLYDGSRQDVWYNGHDGYDFNTFLPPGDMNTPVFAAAGGIVAREPVNRFQDGQDCRFCFGNHVVLIHPNGYLTVYGHLRQNHGLENIHQGDWIEAGYRMGLVDDTGRSDGSHLHFGVYLDQDGNLDMGHREKVDPFGFAPREGADYTEDPWVREGGAVSHYLWIHPLQRDGAPSPSQETALTSPDGNVTVDVPAGAVASETTLRYLALPDHRSTAWLAGTGHTFALTLIDPYGDFVPGFGLPVSITVQYTDLSISNIDENTLALFRWEDEGENWQTLPTTLDQEANSAVSQIDTPGKFALLGVPIRDEVPPITSITVEGKPLDQPDWYTGPITVTFTAEDNVGGAGVALTEYSVDGGVSWQPYIRPLIITQLGTAYIAARSQDIEGNLEEPPVAVQVTIPTWAYLPVLLR